MAFIDSVPGRDHRGLAPDGYRPDSRPMGIYYGRSGRDLLGTDASGQCAYPPFEYRNWHNLHDHTRLLFFRRCVLPAPCSEPAVVCEWWRSRLAGYYEAPVCTTHWPIAAQNSLLVPIEPGVVRGPSGIWVMVDGAQFHDS
jgi:hypothetical protein